MSSTNMPSAQDEAADEDAPLKEGRGSFEGMVVPTKDGFYVRGVVVEDAALPRLLAQSDKGAPKGSDWFLGAVVRVTADLKHVSVKHEPGGEVMQTREGDFWVASNVSAAVVVKPAEVIEGTLERSKGFFGVAGKLVTRDDLAWSLGPGGGKEGQRVRLYGQSKTEVCEPNAQCLIGGSLPLFRVGRAELIQ